MHICPNCSHHSPFLVRICEKCSFVLSLTDPAPMAESIPPLFHRLNSSSPQHSGSISLAAVSDEQQLSERLKQAQFDPLMGQKIGNFRIEEKIGVGGFGVVYRARQIFLEQDFAIKVMHTNHMASAENVERFRREAKSLARLRHDHIVNMSDFGLLPDHGFYLVMEFLKGKSLQVALAERETFSVERILEIVRQSCKVLQYVHKQNIIHRDLKPGNIFLSEDPDFPEKDFVKLIDFGIATIQEEAGSLTGTGLYLGTAKYVSPEQAYGEKELDGRSDLYSLAIILFRMLTYKLPFDGKNAVNIVYHQVHSLAPRLVDLAPWRVWASELEDFFRVALAKDPNDRPSDAMHFWELCEKALKAQLTLELSCDDDISVLLEDDLLAPASAMMLEQLGHVLEIEERAELSPQSYEHSLSAPVVPAASVIEHLNRPSPFQPKPKGISSSHFEDDVLEDASTDLFVDPFLSEKSLVVHSESTPSPSKVPQVFSSPSTSSKVRKATFKPSVQNPFSQKKALLATIEQSFDKEKLEELLAEALRSSEGGLDSVPALSAVKQVQGLKSKELLDSTSMINVFNKVHSLEEVPLLEATSSLAGIGDGTDDYETIIQFPDKTNVVSHAELKSQHQTALDTIVLKKRKDNSKVPSHSSKRLVVLFLLFFVGAFIFGLGLFLKKTPKKKMAIKRSAFLNKVDFAETSEKQKEDDKATKRENAEAIKKESGGFVKEDKSLDLSMKSKKERLAQSGLESSLGEPESKEKKDFTLKQLNFKRKGKERKQFLRRRKRRDLEELAPAIVLRPAKTRSKEVILLLWTKPKAAKVFLKGRQICASTPCRLDGKSGEVISITVSAKSYQTKTLKWRFRSLTPQRLELSLKK